MSNIRVTYTGLITFVVGLVSVFTGFIFTIIVTRQLTQEEFGTWGLIGGLTAYLLIFEPLVSYWATREIARGIDSGKTALITSSMFSIMAIPVYIVIILLFGTQETNVDPSILFFAVILIPVQIMVQVTAAINLGHKPQVTSYGLITSEICKIIAGFILVFYLDLGLFGAILTVFVGALVSVILQVIMSREKLIGKFDTIHIKKWLRLFWIPSYPRISHLLKKSDVVIFALIVGSVSDLAYWAAALPVAGIVLHGTKISRAVYPKLLEGGKKEIFQENLNRVFYFMIPLAAMAIVFAKPGLFALNPLYENAYPVVIVLSIQMFLGNLGQIFAQSLSGIEKVDTNKKATFRDYLKSKLFFLPTLKIIQRTVYIVSLIVMLLLFSNIVESIDLVFYWAIISLVTLIPYTLYLYILVKRDFTPKIDLKGFLKYLSCSVISFGGSFILMENYLNYEISIFEFLPNLIPFVILAILSYLASTYLVDRNTRTLFKAVIKEISGRKN